MIIYFYLTIPATRYCRRFLRRQNRYNTTAKFIPTTLPNTTPQAELIQLELLPMDPSTPPLLNPMQRHLYLPWTQPCRPNSLPPSYYGQPLVADTANISPSKSNSTSPLSPPNENRRPNYSTDKSSATNRCTKINATITTAGTNPSHLLIPQNTPLSIPPTAESNLMAPPDATPPAKWTEQ